ncbi:MAG: alpha/beta hydrolase family protein [Beijerinckiaceae bacterium]
MALKSRSADADSPIHRQMPTILAIILSGLIFLGSLAPLFAAEPEAVRVTVTPEVTITVHVYRPAGQGPFPLVVLSHGAPRTRDMLFTIGNSAFRDQALHFVAAGAIVAVPIRRGYDGRHAQWVESFGDCDAPDYLGAGRATAEDIAATVAAMHRRPDVDATRVALLGQSAGGWGSLAAAAEKTQVRAVVNFAGARGSRGGNRVCAEDKLLAAASVFGAGRRTHQLWLYSANDSFFGPDLARRLHAAFVKAGGEARLEIVSPHGTDGHFYMGDVAAWRDKVNHFLNETGVLR